MINTSTQVKNVLASIHRMSIEDKLIMSSIIFSMSVLELY